MDFLDPKIERRNRLLLYAGYCLVALAILFATVILIYLSYGYGVDRKGNVTQKGLLFISSQPDGAKVELNGQQYKDVTNTRADVPAGTYTLKISSDGYRPWQRQVVVAGSDVQHFDYPFLFPSQLNTATAGELAGQPTLATQSPDKRWIISEDPANPGSFTQYDIKSPAKPIRTTFALPSGSFNAGDGTNTWTAVEWAADNKHVLLLHTYVVSGTAASEYVLLNRDAPTESANLTATLKLNATTTLNLFDARTARVYAFDSAAKTLSVISTADASVISKLDNVVTFKSYGDDQLLYITDKSPTGRDQAGQVTAVLQDGQKSVSLRTLPAGAASYVLNLARYDGDWYAVVGAANDSAAYVYKNPQTQQVAAGNTYPTPYRRLAINAPNYVAFSSNTQYVLVESGQAFVVYDIENLDQYHYVAREQLDQPQTHATWMDGNRLTYISSGKQLVFDYDYRNRQVLQAASPAYLPFFSNNYRFVFTLKAADPATKMILNSTPLTTRSDS